MDVRKPQDRVFSILNDNDSPSFVIRPRHLSSGPKKLLPSLPTRVERPNFLRQEHYSKRTCSISSASSPPLLRFDSSSSSKSSASMDSTPSPITPAYPYNDGQLLTYDNLLRQDLEGYLPSSITPFMEQQLMIIPTLQETLPQYASKPMPVLAPAPYPIAPMPESESQLMSTPNMPSEHSATTSRSTVSARQSPPDGSSNNTPVKRNKYPCPFASSHSCLASFTTSGHAARHGKKHTGEKGVHCPVCNKAFTRKDNMKQHERTHKGSISAGSNSDDSVVRRSKAAITKEAAKSKPEQSISSTNYPSRRSSTILQSPLSEVTSLTPTVVDTPLNLGGESESILFSNPDMAGGVPQMLLPSMDVSGMPPSSLYPPLTDSESMMSSNLMTMLPQSLDKQRYPAGLDFSQPRMAPMLIRGYSDLDTLAAAAAESLDPYYGVM